MMIYAGEGAEEGEGGRARRHRGNVRCVQRDGVNAPALVLSHADVVGIAQVVLEARLAELGSEERNFASDSPNLL